MKIYLYRHGMTPGNMKHQFIGWTDQHLAPEGVAELSKLPAEPKVVYVSPMLRCKETAGILFPNAKQIVVPGFKEINFGEFEEKSFEELSGVEKFQAWADSDQEDVIPGGEIKKDFTARVLKAFWETIAPLDTDEVYTVTHGGTIMAILEALSDPHGDYFSWMSKNGHGWAGIWTGEKITNIEKV